jgi:hypothetical protein
MSGRSPLLVQFTRKAIKLAIVIILGGGGSLLLTSYRILSGNK